MTIVTATDIQDNFGKYLQLVQTGEEIVILRNGVEMARPISRDKTVSFIYDSLVGVLKELLLIQNTDSYNIFSIIVHININKIQIF